MNVRLSHNSYGKHNVRVSKIKRDVADPSQHELIEASVNVLLEGDLEEAYTKGDNRKIVATDTCKNTVYAIAKADPFDTIEGFGIALSSHFLDQYSHLSKVTIELTQHRWSRLLDCPHAFVGGHTETPTAKIVTTRDQPIQVTSGLDHLMIAKTTESGFANFHRDQYRTLPDTDDRILATVLKADWRYAVAAIDFAAARDRIRGAMLAKFIDHYSRSVQETLMLIGTAAIEADPAVESITLTMPNKHHILFDLQPFGLQNNNEVFVVTDQPFGYISATVERTADSSASV